MNVSKVIACVVCLSCLLAVGCTPGPIFYWGNYSQTLYKMKKNPDVKFRETHKQELLKIIEKSKKKKLKTPPGVYCEYGYLLYQDGNTDEALNYINLEETTYPESKTFTQRLKKMISGNKTANDIPDAGSGEMEDDDTSPSSEE